MASSADLRIAMVAGEASGDVLAGRMLSALRPALPEAGLEGIGGPHMAEYGFRSEQSLETMTVRGLFEILPRYLELRRIQHGLRDRYLAQKPAVFIGVDYPGFNLGLEEQLRKGGIPTMHFIGPQIWAWRGWRIKKIMRAVSHLLVIFPFEEEIYRKAGVPATYVGHPLAEVIPMQPNVAAARAQLGLPLTGSVVAVMPGSRMSELKYNSAAFIGAAAILAQRDPGICFVVPTTARGSASTLSMKSPLQASSTCHSPSSTAIACGNGSGRRCACGVRHGFAGSSSVQEADGNRLQDAGSLVPHHAPHGLSAMGGLAQYPGAGIPRAGTDTARCNTASLGRCALAADAGRRAQGKTGAALHRHASQPAAQYRTGKRTSRA